MSFLFFIVVLSALAYVPQFFLGHRQDYKMAMLHGIAGGFIFVGIDHFVSAPGPLCTDDARFLVGLRSRTCLLHRCC